MKYYATKICEKGTIAVDDTLLVKDAVATAGSRILDGFKPLFSAEAVVRLEEKGYAVSGKAHTGEFGLDLVGEFSYYAPQEEKLEGAAAALVKNGDVKAALGVDMNGSTRRSAALAGIDFLKPTYGTVSRYGVISCAASGEQVGVYAPDAEGVKEIMSVIAGHDDKDGTSLPQKEYEYSTDIAVAGKKVCIVKELLEKADDATKANVIKYADALKANGVEVEEISWNFFDLANTAWQILMCAETCNNVSRYDGVKYGHRAKQYKNIDELYVNKQKNDKTGRWILDKGYGDFKMAVGEAVVSVLKPLQDEVARLEKDKAYIDSIIKNNAEKANYYAMKTLRKVQKKVGFPERIR